MVARLVLGSVLAAALAAVPSPTPVGPTNLLVAASRAPAAVRRTFSRRRSPADADESPGEFVHAIERGRVERPVGIVRA